MLFKILILLLVTIHQEQAWAWLNKGNRPFTIMLDPAGDAKNVGRKLYNSFERGATLQFAQELKKQILQTYPNTEVVLTRSAGEVLENLQNANFANRLDVDLYLSINFYEETQIKPHIFLFYFKNQIFFSIISPNNLSFFPYYLAYTINFERTQKYAQIIL